MWALAKLDLSPDAAALSSEIAANAAPFVLRSLGGASPQGLANLLWSYSKLPAAPQPVVAALVAKIATELRASLRAEPAAAGAMGGEQQRPAFDAQALSNSVWALAHLKTRGLDLSALGGAAEAFLEAVALAATRALARLQRSLLALPRGASGAPDAGALLAAAEQEFSCQALVNIVWSEAALAGPACAAHPPLAALFAAANAEAAGRLRATAALLRARRPLPHHHGGGGAGFNEQALANVVHAYERAGLLNGDLLGAVFDVAALRLQMGATSGGGMRDGGGRDGSHDGGAGVLSFKPQELCTLLKACHSGAAPPWALLEALFAVLAARPAAVDGWAAAERAELARAVELYQLRQRAEAAAAAARDAAAAAALRAQLEALEQQMRGIQQQQQQAPAVPAFGALGSETSSSMGASPRTPGAGGDGPAAPALAPAAPSPPLPLPLPFASAAAPQPAVCEPGLFEALATSTAGSLWGSGVAAPAASVRADLSGLLPMTPPPGLGGLGPAAAAAAGLPPWAGMARPAGLGAAGGAAGRY